MANQAMEPSGYDLRAEVEALREDVDKLCNRITNLEAEQSEHDGRIRTASDSASRALDVFAYVSEVTGQATPVRAQRRGRTFPARDRGGAG